MYPTLANHWLGLSIQAIFPITCVNGIAWHAISRTANFQIDVVRDFLGLGLRQTKLFTEIHDRKNLIADEATLAGALGQGLMSHTEEFVRIARETHQDLVGLLAMHSREGSVESRPQDRLKHAA